MLRPLYNEAEALRSVKLRKVEFPLLQKGFWNISRANSKLLFAFLKSESVLRLTNVLIIYVDSDFKKKLYKGKFLIWYQFRYMSNLKSLNQIGLIDYLLDLVRIAMSDQKCSYESKSTSRIDPKVVSEPDLLRFFVHVSPFGYLFGSQYVPLGIVKWKLFSTFTDYL